MTQRDPLVPFRNMLDHAREAVALTRGRTEAEVTSDRVLTLALVRLLEVIGEAANRVPPQERSWHSAIAWQPIIGLRNRLIHGYDTVDLRILWQIISTDLPPLIAALEAIVPDAGTPDSSPGN